MIKQPQETPMKIHQISRHQNQEATGILTARQKSRESFRAVLEVFPSRRTSGWEASPVS